MCVYINLHNLHTCIKHTWKYTHIGTLHAQHLADQMTNGTSVSIWLSSCWHSVFKRSYFLKPEKTQDYIFFSFEWWASFFQVLNNKDHQYYIVYVPHPAPWCLKSNHKQKAISCKLQNYTRHTEEWLLGLCKLPYPLPNIITSCLYFYIPLR